MLIAKYLGQTSLNAHTDTHAQTDCRNWTTKVVGRLIAIVLAVSISRLSLSLALVFALL